MFLFLSCGGCKLQPRGRMVQMFTAHLLLHFWSLCVTFELSQVTREDFFFVPECVQICTDL